MAEADREVGGRYVPLDELYDEYEDEPGAVVDADCYHAKDFSPLSSD